MTLILHIIINYKEKVQNPYHLSKYDLLPPNGKLYPNFCIINIKIYYYELSDKFYVKLPGNYSEEELEKLEEDINCIYQKFYNL